MEDLLSADIIKEMKGIERSNARLLLVDPAPAVRQVLGDFLSSFYRFSTVGTSAQAEEALAKLQVDVLLLDANLPNASRLVRQVGKSSRPVPILVLSHGPDLKHTGRRARVLPKALMRSEIGRAQLLLGIERCIHEPQPEDTGKAAETLGISPALVGHSDVAEALRAEVMRAAGADLTVLLSGETGTGKSLIARVLHDASPMSHKAPFISVEPSAVAPTLFESALFGHARGAFTGATHERAGAFEAAQNGTLFLDEIGDVEPILQRKLLRAVEERVIRRVGDIREIHLDLRIVSATNRDIEADISSGRFRADLFQRLNEIHIRVPTLKQRIEDVVPLFLHFLRQRDATVEARVDSGATRLLKRYPWPGNVRELRTVARRIHAAGVPATLREEDISPLLQSGQPSQPLSEKGLTPDQRIQNFSRQTYLEALGENFFNIRKSARAIGVPYHTLRSRLRALDLLDVIQAKK